ncbi:MAG TPA: alginate export family protein [Polyangiaceae bacterium]|nr:alginate export family protein [Polyangiaceae bacterium]
MQFPRSIHVPSVALASWLVSSSAFAQEAAPATPAPAPTGTDAGASASASASASTTAAPAASTESAAAAPAAPAAEPAPAAVAPAAPEEAEKPSLLPFTVNTSTWSRFEARANYDTLGVSRGRFQEGDAFFYRARLGFRTNALKLADDFTGLVQFTPQASGKFGLTGTTTEAALGLYEGYVRLATSKFSFEAGRFAMNYGDALVIGNLDWSQTGRAFDGVRTRYSLGDAWIDAFATLTAPDGLALAEGHPIVNEPFLAGDYYFWGVYAGLGALVKKGMDLDVYLLGNSNVETAGIPSVAVPPGPPLTRGGATELTLGARVKDKLGPIDYRVEAGIQFGTRPLTSAVGGNQTVFAYQADGEVGYSFTPKLRLALNGIVASGDDAATPDGEGWHDLYPTGHKFLGLMDVIGARTNVGSAVLKLNAGITDSLKAVLDAHIFTRLQDGGLGQVGADKLAGYELDGQLIKKWGPGHVRGLYGLFIPNSGHYASNDLAHYVEIEGGLVF